MIASASSLRPAQPGGHSRLANTALWVLQVLLFLAFILPVYRKFAGVQESVDLFEELGFGQWLRYAVGLLELVLAVGLLVPRLAGPAALALVGVMAGAVVTEVFVESGRWLLPLVLMGLAAAVAWGRRDQSLALLRRR